MCDHLRDKQRKITGEVNFGHRASFDNKAWLALLLSFMLFSCSSSEEVVIEKAPESVSKHVYDQGNRPKSQIKLHPSVEANTHWEFNFVPEIQVRRTRLERNGEEFIALVKVEKVKIDLALPIDVWLPESASEKVIAHEEGHIALCKHFYKDAGFSARQAANALLGREFSGHGKSESECTKNAIEAASAVLSEAYQERIVLPAHRASATYDELTAHGQNSMSEAEAIELSKKAAH